MAAPVLHAMKRTSCPCRNCQEAAGLGDRVPIQIDTSANQISALNIVHNSFQDQELRGMKRKLADTMREMERARMATEDAKGRCQDEYWQKSKCQDEVGRLVYKVVGPAKDIIEEARADIRVVMDNHQGDGRQAALAGALTASYNALIDVEKVLRDDESDGQHTDSDSVIDEQ